MNQMTPVRCTQRGTSIAQDGYYARRRQTLLKSTREIKVVKRMDSFSSAGLLQHTGCLRFLAVGGRRMISMTSLLLLHSTAANPHTLSLRKVQRRRNSVRIFGSRRSGHYSHRNHGIRAGQALRKVQASLLKTCLNPNVKTVQLFAGFKTPFLNQVYRQTPAGVKC
jgi:hypothetical protein